MTTVIACRSLGAMAADKKISHGDGSFPSSKKIQRAGKFIVGLAGDYGRALAYLEVFKKKAKGLDGRTAPKLPAAEGEGDLELVVMSEHGIWLYFEDGTPMEVEEVDYYTTGTGGKWAAVSLDTQAEMKVQPLDLSIAMAVACKHDENSSLPMVTLYLKKGKNEPGETAAAERPAGDQPAPRRARQRRA
jgi:hypothetical protein